MPESNLDIARRGYAAVTCGDIDAIREFLDPNAQVVVIMRLPGSAG